MPDPGALAPYGCLGAGLRAWGSILAVGTNATCAKAAAHSFTLPGNDSPPLWRFWPSFCFGISFFHLSREIGGL